MLFAAILYALGRAKETDEFAILKTVLDTQLLRHPLPWYIESDWTHQIVASDGCTISKCKSHAQAQAVIEYAINRQNEFDELASEIAT